MIRLEKFDHSDYNRLIAWADTAETLMQFAGPVFAFPLTKEQLDASLSDANRHAFKAVDIATGIAIGHAEIYVSNESAYLGRILVGEPTQRGRGIGRQIVQALLCLAFEHLNLPKVALNVFDWNAAAIRCYEKAGFRLNPGKKAERTINGQTWIALNMILDKTTWMQLEYAKKTGSENDRQVT